MVGGPATCSDVVEEINRRKQRGLNPFVFFLDEFPRVRVRAGVTNEYKAREAREKYLRVMKNVFRSFSLPVVISSTNGAARYLVVVSERSCPGPPIAWCTVFPSLPAAVIVQDVPMPRQQLNLISHSRPLFGITALKYLQANPYTGGDLLDYLNEMVDMLAQTFFSLKLRSVGFELGQFCALVLS